LRTSNSHPLSRGLVAAWPMNEQGGNRLWDLSLSRRPATLTGGAWVGQGLRLDGIAGHADTTVNLSILSQLSVVARVRVKHAGVGSVVDNSSVQLIEDFDDAVFVTTGAEARVNGVFTVDSWIHLVGTYGGGRSRLYINGILRANVAAGALAIVGTMMTIGVSWDGDVDYVAVYGRRLSPGEVFRLANEPWDFLDGRHSRVV